MKKIIVALLGLALLFGTAACATESDSAIHNSEKQAERFDQQRGISFINGITDKELLRVEGKCSHQTKGTLFVVICKTGKQKYLRHTLVRSDNVFAVVEQTKPGELDPNHYEFTLRPQTVIPDINLDTESTKD